MAKTASINVRVNPDLKKEAEEICTQLGITLSGAINAFLHTVAREQRIPLDLSLRIPNAETIAAMEEAEAVMRGELEAKWYTDVDELIADLQSDD